MSSISSLGFIARGMGVLAFLALGPGCYAEAGAEPVYVDVAPIAYETAPQYNYEGRTVYYVNDHWYARERQGWVYYRSEPAPLVRYRTQVQRAPRAPERMRVIERRESAPRAEPVRLRAEPVRRENARPDSERRNDLHDDHDQHERSGRAEHRD